MTTGKQAFLDLVNHDNQTSLTQEDVIFGSVTDEGDRSHVTLVANPEGRYTRSVTFDYRRLRLSHLFGFFQPRVTVPDGVTPTVELFIEWVAERYGIRFEADVLTITAKTTEEGNFYIVEAKDSSLVYNDQATFLLDFSKIEISTVIGPETHNFIYPTTQDETQPLLGDALVYSSGWIVSEAAVDLGELLVGNFATDNLRWLTSTLSGEDWVSLKDTLTERNLYGAYVVHNGPVAEYELLRIQDVSILNSKAATNVLVLKLDPTTCSNLTGYLTYYY